MCGGGGLIPNTAGVSGNDKTPPPALMLQQTTYTERREAGPKLLFLFSIGNKRSLGHSTSCRLPQKGRWNRLLTLTLLSTGKGTRRGGVEAATRAMAKTGMDGSLLKVLLAV